MKKIKSIHLQKELSPCPGFDTGLMDRINKKLKEELKGNYSVVINKISQQFKTWIDYEYHSDVTIQIVDNNNVSRKDTTLCVPGMGMNVELNTNRKLHTNNFFTWNDFEEQLFTKANYWQNEINNNGYYYKPKK